MPLPGHDGRPVGMVQLDRRTGKKGFKPGDLDLLAALAVPVGVAVENHWLLKERASWAAAREIQLSLLPRDRPEVPGYAFWECYQPTLEVGGDLYDYIKVEDSEQAAGFTRAVGRDRRRRRRQGHAGRAPGRRHLPGSTSPGSEWCRAGRGDGQGQPPSLRSRSRRPVRDDGHDGNRPEVTPDDGGQRRAHGPPGAPRVGRDRGRRPLGGRHAAGRLSAPPFIDRYAVPLEPGDLVVLYTDGVTESMNQDRQEFGVERLKKVLAAAPESAAAAGEAILGAVREHAIGRSQSDDITIVCFERIC